MWNDWYYWLWSEKAAKMALVSVRLCLESNYSSIDCVILCTNESLHDYEIYKDLMSTVYIPVWKYHLTNIFMKELKYWFFC